MPDLSPDLTYTQIAGVVMRIAHDNAVRLNAGICGSDLRLLLAIHELGGEISGASHRLVEDLGASNATVIRRSASALAAHDLVASASRRGVGLRLQLTLRGREIAKSMLDEIRAELEPAEGTEARDAA